MARLKDVDNPSRDPLVDPDPEIEDYDLPESYQGATQYGTTAAEERMPESEIDRLKRESPDEWVPDERRPDNVGQLADPSGIIDTEKDEIGEEFPLDSIDVPAEEAAIHVVSDDEI